MSERLLIIAAAILGLIGLSAVAVLVLFVPMGRKNRPPGPDERE
jgi:hypothetical protein